MRWYGSTGASRPASIQRADHRRLLVDQPLQPSAKRVAEDRRALDDLHGEEPRGLGVVAAQFQLPVDIGGDLGRRVAGGVEVLERLQPHLVGAVEHREVDVLLAAEIVEEVRLGHAGARRDLVDGGAAIAPGRKHLQRRVEDLLLVLLLDAGALPRAAGAGGVHLARAGRRHRRRFPSRPRRFRGTMPLERGFELV